MPSPVKSGARGVATAATCGCAVIAMGSALLAASFGALSLRGSAGAVAAAPAPAEDEEPAPGSLAVGSLAFEGQAPGAVAATAQRGQPIPFRFELSGLSTGADGEWSVVVDLQVVAPSGVKVVEGKLFQDRGTGPQPLPARGTIDLAPWSPPGSYALTLKVEDVVAKTEVELEQAFELR